MGCQYRNGGGLGKVTREVMPELDVFRKWEVRPFAGKETENRKRLEESGKGL